MNRAIRVAVGLLIWVFTAGLAWFFWNAFDAVGFCAFLAFSVGSGFVVTGLVNPGWAADPPLAGEKGHGGGRKATQAEAKETLGGKEQRPLWALHHYQD